MKQLRNKKWSMYLLTMVILVLCFAMSLPGMLISIPTARAADTGIWTQLPLYGGSISALAINPLTPTTLYAGSYGSGVFRSTDSGATWKATGIADGGILSLAINPHTPSILYAAISTLAPATLYAGGIGVFRSTDSGATWTAANTGFPTYAYAQCLAIDPLTPTTLYAGTDGGVFRSMDSGAHWTAVNTGLTNLGVSALAINPLTPTTLYAGSYGSGVFRSTDSGATWSAVNTGLTGHPVYSLAINPKAPATLYAGTDSGVFRSTNGGDHWTATTFLPNTELNNRDVHFLAINPKAPATLYAGTSVGSVFCSTDSGERWTEMNTGGSNAASLAINPLTPTILYAGSSGSGIFRSTDSGKTWSAPNTDFPQYTTASCLAINPKAPATLYAGTYNGNAGTGSGVFYSTNSGATWTSLGIGITNQKVTSLAIDPLTPSILYAATNGGVFRYGAASSSKRTIQLKIGSTTMKVDGKPVSLEAAPIILNARTFLPIRAVVEAAGGTITWDASAQKATVVRKDKTLELWIGKNTAKLNGTSVTIDSNTKVVPVIKSGRTLLPLRFVAEILALDVQWNPRTQVITITYTP
jgi:photosystem II stability/assembly factor-like uncharacterized protein